MTGGVPCAALPFGAIADLSIALAGRWDPERLFLLIYTAYMDESGTHGDSLITVVGGVLASAKQWSDFETEFDRIKKRHGFRIFHTKKFKARQGDFRGWTDEQVAALLIDMARLTNDTFTESVDVKIDNREFEEEYRKGEKPRKFQLDSKYGLAFRQCLMFFVLEMEKRRFRGRFPKLNIVVESGAKNVGASVTIFNEMKAELKSLGIDTLQAMSIMDKDECDPLMAADFIAHMRYALEMNGAIGEIRQIGSKPGPGEAGITHLEFKPGGLSNFKQKLIERAQARRRKS